MTEEEATEAMQVAMTVAATRMQVLLNAELTKLGAPPESPAAAAPANPRPAEKGAAPTVESAAPAVPSPPRFTAADVVPQAGGG